MQNKTHFDYIIIGSGLAGLQLAMAFHEDPYFKTKQIALIDKSSKSTNDRTWSFWEKGDGKWDSIINHSWDKALFRSARCKVDLNLKEYQYKSIRAIDFYQFAQSKLNEASNFHFFQDEILELSEDKIVYIQGEKGTFSADHVFDSRIPKAFHEKPSKYTLLQQHFVGWIIETENPCFDTETFVMMDYRWKYEDSTSFIYVLPYSKTRALIEFTFFTPKLVTEKVYEDALKTYIKEQLKIETYQIIERESGNIPMTDFPFENSNTKLVTKIGTAGGWVKGSTGYSFKNTEKKVERLLNNIKSNRDTTHQLQSRKYQFYDRIFLKVLYDENEKGEWIFEQFYSKNTIQTMFRFLDEESSFREDLRIMNSLFSWSFIKTFFKILFR